MQDKPTNIDKKFTNRAWGEMRQALDREMPAARKRRRFGWWWLFPLALVFGTAAWVAAKHWQAAPEKEQATATPSTPIAIHSKAADAAGDTVQNAGEETKTGINQSETAATERVGETNLITSPPAKTNKFGGDKLPFSIFSKKENMVQLPDSSVVVVAQASKVENISLVSETQPDFRKAENPSLASLENALLDPLDYQSETALDLAEPKIHIQKHFLSFQAGAMISTNSIGNGLAGGATMNIPFKNSRLSLEGGLGYAFIQQPLSVEIKEDITTTGPGTGIFTDEFNYSIADNTKNTDVAESSNSTQYLSTGLKLHYVQMPLTLGYRVGNRLRFHAGIEAGLLLHWTQGFDDVLKVDTNAGGFSSLDNSKLPIPISRFDLAALGGLTYQISPALGIRLQHRFGLADLLKSNGRGDYNRMLGLSLRYSF